MSNEAKLVQDLGRGWTLRRWEYDGAPLELHGPHDTMVSTPDADGDIEIETQEPAGWSGGTGTVRRYIPAAGLRALLGDAP